MTYLIDASKDHANAPKNSETSYKPRWMVSILTMKTGHKLADCVWKVMAHAQKPDFVFRRNGRVHLNRRGGGVSSVDYWQPRCAHQRQ